ncbi:MAG: S8 family peptidase [Pseudomonadota bacterium]
MRSYHLATLAREILQSLGIGPIYAACLTVFLSAACSSGGGGNDDVVVTAPPVVQSPQPVQEPDPRFTPPSSVFGTAEFDVNSEFDQVNARSAFEAGINGDGVLVAIVDSGINADNPEFAGRIDPRSADLLIPSVVGPLDARIGGPDITDMDDHGTPIAALIGAARNGIGMQGIAPEADLLIFRADDDSGAELSILGAAVFEGVSRASAAGAGVLNLSIGSTAADARLQFGSIFGIAAGGDIVTVVAAGNDGTADPDNSALAAIDPQADGTVIIAGAVRGNGNNTIASFSARAGEGAEFFLVAPGLSLSTPANNDSAELASAFFAGTSASTPIIAGAAALIRQVWPGLSAQEVVEILLTSATDLGAPGTDPIYGRGLLNIGAALAPSGALSTSSITGSSIILGAESGSLSPVFGSGVLELGDVVALDRFNRDFSVSLGGSLRWTENLAVDPIALVDPFRSIQQATQNIGGATFSFSLQNETFTEQSVEALLRAPAFGDDRDTEQVLRFAMNKKLDSRYDIGLAQGFAPRNADHILSDGSAVSPGSISRDGFNDPYLGLGQSSAVTRMRTRLFGAGIDVFAATSDRRKSYLDDLNTIQSAQTSNVRIGFNFGKPKARFSLQSGVRQEEDAIFGARFGGAFGEVADSTTIYQSAVADLHITAGWRMHARASVGLSEVQLTGLNSFGGEISGLTSTQFAAGLYRNDLLTRGDKISLAVLQPLRIESGAYVFDGAVGFDPFQNQLSFAEQSLDLSSPTREIDLEARYQLYRFLGNGFLEASLLQQFNALGGEQNAVTGLIRAGGAF